jgi:hypothetical protein
MTLGRRDAIPATVGPVRPPPCSQHHAGHCYNHSGAVRYAGTGRRHACHCMKGNGVATLAQNKIFPAKQELLLSEITGLPLDAQMQRNRLDVDERVEGSRQCSCSHPS